jgi:hypothetical protein
LCIIPLQLLSYHIAVHRGVDVRGCTATWCRRVLNAVLQVDFPRMFADRERRYQILTYVRRREFGKVWCVSDGVQAAQC